jgi:hypothetical protein
MLSYSPKDTGDTAHVALKLVYGASQNPEDV